MRIPSDLDHLRAEPDGAEWLDRLPGLVEEARSVLGVEVDVERPFDGAYVSWVVPGRWHDQDVVVKFAWPHPEAEGEAAALAAWGGRGAVRLLAHDPERSILVLERCRPGTKLSAADPVAALAVGIDLLTRHWIPGPGPFRSLADEARGWLAGLDDSWEAHGRPCERRLVDAATDHLTHLIDTQGPQGLVNQDMHGHNILAAERELWLVVDPKPLAGERAFAPVPVVRSAEFGHSRDHVLRKLHESCDALGVDAERTRGWAIGQMMAWGFGSPRMSRYHEVVRWLLGDA